MSEFQHSVHFVGSYPAESADGAIYDMTYIGGEGLSQVSDGETGARKNWVVNQIESYRDNPAFELVRDGHWTSYDDCPEFKVADGHILSPDDFGLRYHADAVASWRTFDHVRRELGRPDIKFQVGIPHALDMSLFTFGMERGLDPGLERVYTQATLRQIEAIRDEPFGDEVVFQIETPATMSSLLLPPKDLPPKLHLQELGQGLAWLAAQAPAETEFGVHLCVGDLGNEARAQFASRASAVMMANTISVEWPHDKKLLYIHEPIAAGKKPPIVDEQAYSGLQHLALGQETRYIAGMVHERQPIDEQRQVLAYIKDALPEGQALGLAAACGLGRRSWQAARKVGRRTTALARS